MPTKKSNASVTLKRQLHMKKLLNKIKREIGLDIKETVPKKLKLKTHYKLLLYYTLNFDNIMSTTPLETEVV